MKDGEKWTISIGSWNGLCPSYFDNSYAFLGNKDQATLTTDIDIRDPNVLTQGYGVTDLTNGSHAGELGEENIIAILKHATSTNVSYACSNDKVFKLSATAVLNGNFPLSLSGGTYQVATDLLYYYSDVFVFWNDTGTEGEIAKVDISAPSIDVDWGSTTPATGAAHLEDAPHHGVVGGDSAMYVTNGRYIAKYKGSSDTLTVHGLDFWSDSETVSVTWNWNRVVIALNRPNVAGSNMNLSGIYKWNGISSDHEGDPIEVQGEIGALYTKNGITYVWWKDAITTGGYNFGYINGSRLDLIRRYAGSLPNQAQVGNYDGFIGWISSNKLVLWGAKDKDLAVNMFGFMSGQYGTVGTWAAPFGTPLISSTENAVFAAATNDTITSDAHGLSDDDTVRLTTTNALPGGLSTATTYYVIESATNTFQLSASKGGTKIDITDTGTGTHTWHRYSLAKADGYSIGARRNSIAYNMRAPGFKAQIDLVQVGFETLASGAKLDTTITYDQEASTKSLTQIAYSATDATTVRKIYNGGIQINDFRVDFSWANGSITNPFKIRTLLIGGRWIKQN